MANRKQFTLVTVTKRDGWFDRACAQVAKQTHKPEKWIIVPEGDFSGFHGDYPCPVEFWPAPPKLRLSNLNASLNEGLRHVNTDYVIFYQDFIDLGYKCFEKLMGLVDENTFVTTLTKNDTDVEDQRLTGVLGPRACIAEDWEANVGAAPMSVIYQLGGFDEEYDNGWSWDNRNLAERASRLGVHFILDESNRPQLLYHPKETEMPINAGFHNRVMEEIDKGLRPLKCNYL